MKNLFTVQRFIFLRNASMLLLICCLSIMQPFAQGNYTTLTRGLPIALIASPTSPAPTPVGTGDDFAVNVPIGFSFSFYGNSYTSLTLSSNGYIAFGANPGSYGQMLPSSSAIDILAFAWADLYIDNTSTVNYFTIGTAPNRILVINYRNVRHYSSDPNNNIDVQLQLYEGSNAIEIHNVLNRSSYVYHTLGIQGTVAQYLTQASLNRVIFSGTSALVNEMIRFSACDTPLSQIPTISASSNTMCAGGTVNLTATGCLPTQQVTWSNGSLGASISVSPSSTTSYTALCLEIASGCQSATASNSQSITVSGNLPIISASATGSCGSQTITMSTQSLPTGTFQWKLNGNIIVGATASSYSTTIAGTYTVDYTTNNCTATSVAYVFSQNAAPTIALTAPVSPSCNATLNATGCSGTVRWYVNINNAWVYLATANPYVFPSSTNPSEYRATCYNNNCESPASNVVKATPNNFIEITYSGSLSLCSDNTILLNASSATSGLTYQWQRNNSNITGATSATYAATSVGQYSVIVTNGVCNFTSGQVTVNSGSTTPIISATVSGTCGNESVVMNTQSLPTGTLQWKLNGNIIQGATSSSYSTTIAGSYTVEHLDNGCTATSTAYVFVRNSPPVIAQLAPISPSCNATLTATGCSGTVYWYRNDNNTWVQAGSGSPFVFLTNNSSTQYRATCFANSCESAVSNTIVAMPNNFTEITPTGSVKLCTTNGVLLNASSTFTGLTYQWQRNNVNIVGATNASYAPTLAGQYKLFVTSGLCNFTTGIVTVTTPVISASFTGTCGSQTINMVTASVATGTLQWKLDGVNIAGATAASYSTTVTGNYTVEHLDNGCTSVSSPYIFAPITTPSIALIAPVSPSCNPTLAATGCTGTVRWYVNISNTWQYVTTGSSYNFPSSNTPSEYRATCYANNCESSPSNVVKGIPNNFTEITPTTPIICTGGSVLLNASSTFTGLTYQWQRNNVDISGATAVSYNATLAGQYTLMVTNGTCSFTSSMVNAVVSSPTVPIITTSLSGVCESQTVLMNTQSLPAGSFQWKLNGNNISGATAPSYSTAIVGSYTVSYTASVSGCSATSSAYVFAQNAPPTIALVAPISPSTNATLTATGCSGTPRWYINISNNWQYVSSSNPFVFPVTTNPSEYRATCYANNCESSPSAPLKAIPNNFTEITPINPTICTGGAILLNASSTFTGLTYQWRRNNTTIPSATNASYSATLAGQYTLMVTNSTGTFTSGISTVTLATAPVLSITSTVASPATITNGSGLTLTANGCTNGTVLWSNNAITTAITVTPSTSTTYTFTCTQLPCVITSSGFVINVNPLLPPTISSSASSTCTGTSITLTATGCPIGGIVTWNTSPSQTGTSIVVSPSVATSYSATCTLGIVTSDSSTPLSISIFNGAIISLNSGNWNNPATWSCNCIPAACNDVTVDTGHIVIIQTNITGMLKNLTLRGTVEMKSPSIMALK